MLNIKKYWNLCNVATNHPITQKTHKVLGIQKHYESNFLTPNANCLLRYSITCAKDPCIKQSYVNIKMITNQFNSQIWILNMM